MWKTYEKLDNERERCKAREREITHEILAVLDEFELVAKTNKKTLQVEDLAL